MESTLSLLIKSLMGSVTSLNVPAAITVRELKERIALDTKIPASSQLLSFNGQELLDAKKLQDYDFGIGNALALGIEIEIESEIGVVIQLTIAPPKQPVKVQCDKCQGKCKTCICGVFRGYKYVGGNEGGAYCNNCGTKWNNFTDWNIGKVIPCAQCKGTGEIVSPPS